MDRTVFRTFEAVEVFGLNHVRREVARRRWQKPSRGVVVTHNGPLTRTEELVVALSAGAPGAAIAGLSALEIDGFDGFVEKRPTIVLPEGARLPTLPSATFHWSTELTDVDVHPSRAPRRTRPARSVVDASSWSTHDRRARVIVIAAVQQGLVRPDDLRRALSRRGPCRRRALIKESVLDAVGGIQSLPERDFDAIRAEARLPRPQRQSRRVRSDGRAYLDVEWPEFDAACEIHGIPHLEVRQWDRDLDRNNDVVIGGPRLLIFSSFATRHRKARIAEQLHALLRRGGWSGPPLRDTDLEALRRPPRRYAS